MTTTSNSLALQIKDLLSTLSEHGRQHLNELETDLMQTNVLLTEAIEKLGASFMAIHEAVIAQQQLVDTLLTKEESLPTDVVRLREQASQIDLHVNSAVTGLQFQDMTNQLIGRTMRRVVGFRDVLEILGNGANGLESEESEDRMVRALSKINEMLEAENAVLERELWKAVRQTHMESGDIELF
ncbi:chemotaxis protein [Oxalicibacterium solurbis]|uniref:Chemotaxis protein n=1 Tax=Oxalicibacterium solurbis TaxID=69280 RepID=A0A8J3AWD9_9BURK|nr:chemotaxis protein [Oxalicibacterium solurbis]GGI54550.1 hypothetical protein GCM10011430_17240 [Oxalicibacterium solurbis]